MSDESAPQQEPRLKLRSEADNGTAQSPGAPPPPPAPGPESPAGAAPEKVRLKVRIPIEPTPAAPPAEPPVPVGAPEPPSLPAREDKGEAGIKLKLKPKVVPPPGSIPPAPAQAALTPPAPTPEVSEVPAAYHPPFPPPPAPPGTRPFVRIEAKSGAAVPPPPAPPPAPVPEPPLLTSVEAKPPNLRLGLVTILLFGIVVIVFSGIGYRTYKKLTTMPAKPVPQSVLKATPAPPATKPAAPTTPEGRAVQKAREVVAAVSANRTGPANEVMESTRGSTAVAPKAPSAAASPAVVAPSQRFRMFIDRLKVGGVRVGPPARMFLGGVTYKPGDVIDQELGVVFVNVDVTAQEMVFRDGTGAEVRRRY